MANTPAGADGEKVTEGVEVRVYLSPSEHATLRKRAVERTVKAGRPIAMAQVLREAIRRGLGLRRTGTED